MPIGFEGTCELDERTSERVVLVSACYKFMAVVLHGFGKRETIMIQY